MPFHKVDRERNKLICVEPTTYASERWLERDDLQPLLRDNPEVLDLTSVLFVCCPRD